MEFLRTCRAYHVGPRAGQFWRGLQFAVTIPSERDLWRQELRERNAQRALGREHGDLERAGVRIVAEIVSTAGDGVGADGKTTAARRRGFHNNCAGAAVVRSDGVVDDRAHPVGGDHNHV